MVSHHKKNLFLNLLVLPSIVTTVPRTVKNRIMYINKITVRGSDANTSENYFHLLVCIFSHRTHRKSLSKHHFLVGFFNSSMVSHRENN